MSYPRKIQVAIVEDEAPVIESYRQIFEALGKTRSIAPLIVASSYDDAKALLAGNTIIHLLVLDLGLPMRTRGEAQIGVEPGQAILDFAMKRDGFPIPAVLVVSGRLNHAKLPGLKDRLSQFCYGEIISKGQDEEDEIRKALDAVDRYTAIGVHIRDTRRHSPILAPREEDLLRRCAMANASIGLDLRWWGGYAAASSSKSDLEAKVLVGEFLLDGGFGRSRQTFFKFEQAANVGGVYRDVGIMNQKLQHVKVVCTLSAHARGLLATQNVADTSGSMSLLDFVQRPSSEVLASIPSIVSDVQEQLNRLGETSDVQRRASSLVWSHHDADRLKRVWEQIKGPKVTEAIDPVLLLSKLRSDSTLVWVSERQCNHGDLNPTNIAIDTSGDRTKAYIFDAGGVHSDIACRDLAYLEATLLVHQSPSTDVSLVDSCVDLYREGSILAKVNAKSESIENTKALIRKIRDVIDASEKKNYALAVLDAALIQLGGLEFGMTHNKIASPLEIAKLVGYAAEWYAGFSKSNSTDLRAIR